MVKPSTRARRRSQPRHAQSGASLSADVLTGGWGGFVAASCQLGLEASLVIPLRLVRLASGGEAAAKEARLMIDEKVEAHGVVLGAIGKGTYGLSAGEIANGAMRHYLACVRANRRRLMSGR